LKVDGGFYEAIEVFNNFFCLSGVLQNKRHGSMKITGAL
tara:strand:+ start:572 stop:688 length:117 start_codon:yes stop_codon:yes gene_type:complete